MILWTKSPNRSYWFWGPNRETVAEILRPKHWQTVDLGFEAKPRNLHSSSPHARCRPQTTSPDISIVRPLSTRPVWSFPVLCTKSPTSATILITAHHAALVTCTLRDKQTWFSTWNKVKGKTTEISQIRIQTMACQWLITYQIKVLSTWFRIQNPMKHS
jgi:hypothetical protein